MLPKLWFSILIILVQAPLLGHAPTAIPPIQCAFLKLSISVLTPREQWLEVQIFSSSGKLVKPTQVNDPNKPVSIYFDVCATIAKNTRP
jgi:hypothetical protein